MAIKYSVYIRPQAWQELKRLPGHMRQRARREMDALESEPRPTRGRRLHTPDDDREVWRLRLDDWRILYVIEDTIEQVQILTIRQRPPYDYGDLDELLRALE